MATFPISSVGIAPQAGGVFNEVASLTRRAVVPRVTVQLYFAGPTLMMLLGGAQRSAGGLNQITFPVQGASMVQGAWTGYQGTFNKPQVLPGVQNAQFMTSYFVVPVPLVLGETLIQSTEAIMPIIDVRMNDVYAVTQQQMTSALFTNNTANALMPQGFVEAFDDGTNVTTYGGIVRTASGNNFWKSNLFTSVGAILTRQFFSRYLLQVTDLAGGEKPDFIVMAPGDYSALNSTFITAESVNTFPGRVYGLDAEMRSSFPNINISGVPVYADHWCPKGTMYMINTKYTALYLSEDAAFEFSDFYSTIPVLQLAQIAVMVVGYNVLCAKPLSGAQLTGITGGDF